MKQTHCEIILNALKDYQWHNVIEIMQNGFPRCLNVAIRSRISNLKQKGYEIESRIDDNRQAAYRLIKENTYIQQELKAIKESEAENGKDNM